VERTVKKHRIEFDIIYSHFLRNAFVSLEALKKNKKPFIAAVGENKGFELTKSWLGARKFDELITKISGFVTVSEQIKEKLLSHNIPEQKVIVEPNATDLFIFRKMDKQQFRKKYEIPMNHFIVAFTGNFIESKGPHRVLQAIEGLENVSAIMIGRGPIELKSSQIVFNQRVPGHLVPELLNCADIFVLPTLHEGSNNSIIEAMACGLPIISSDIPEVRSQCDPSFSILVNPMNINEIRDSVVKLAGNQQLRETMSENAMVWSKRFDLNQRASNILEFIESFIHHK
jgi:glycosyltransferase involved in cell wall biosynthesis